MVERLDSVVVAMALTLDIVIPIQGRHGPAPAVLGVEKADLYDDATRIGLREKVLETPEIFRVPAVQIETIAPRAVTWHVAARPRLNQLSGLGRECIFRMKCAFRFDECRRVNACVV